MQEPSITDYAVWGGGRIYMHERLVPLTSRDCLGLPANKRFTWFNLNADSMCGTPGDRSSVGTSFIHAFKKKNVLNVVKETGPC